ncbi:GNAT family N-acetyltransferase [Clostridium amazonitimonense]|uniref:GNAT family N-acetyltransferase n=1 Tax=Clostridium amazonitimonense TaxID=1499689 RepID=UPI000509C54E|nr:GNAT family protein [Clostridium amazonitimonense]
MDYNCKDIKLRSPRLSLEQFELERDLKDYSNIMKEDDVGKWLPKGQGYSFEESRRFMEYILEHWNKHGYGAWAVKDINTGKILGHCGLNKISSINEVEVLYALGKEGRGKGYGTEAARVSLEYGFNVLNLKEIIALTKPLNKASQNVIKKLGMKYIKDIELFNQEFRYYSITREEFNNSN